MKKSIKSPFKFMKRLGIAGYDASQYELHLSQFGDNWPSEVISYARFPGRLDPSATNAFHDSWLENFSVEISSGKCSIVASFLGPYHDKRFDFSYDYVDSLHLENAADRVDRDDIVIDEILFSENIITHAVLCVSGYFHIIRSRSFNWRITDIVS